MSAINFESEMCGIFKLNKKNVSVAFALSVYPFYLYLYIGSVYMLYTPTYGWIYIQHQIPDLRSMYLFTCTMVLYYGHVIPILARLIRY